jgi:hypothetical protein
MSACLHVCIPAFLRSCIPAFLHSCIPAFLHSCIRAFPYWRILPSKFTPASFSGLLVVGMAPSVQR